MARRNRLFALWRGAALRHGFEEYDAPVVETEELLTRKSGEEIVNQIYNFTDKSGRHLALRPEMTPSLARMVIARQKSLPLPLKWFSLPQCFRYERMTRGRKREHFQWNLDIIGEEGAIAEAEVLSTAITALRDAGLSARDFKVCVGDRALLEALFQAMEIPTEQFGSVCLALDKRDKIGDEQITALLETEGLTVSSIDKVFRLMAIENLEEAGKVLGENQALTRLQELFTLMQGYGMEDFLVFDLSVIRGLDYYTGVVFEAFDREKKFRAIFGGGRYDNLLSSLGGDKVPSVGLGFGDVVVCELVDHLGLELVPEQRLDVFLGYLTGEEQALALQGAARLRESGKTVNIQLRPQKAKKLFAAASRAQARYALFIGPSEREMNRLMVKNLETGQQEQVGLEALSKVVI